MADDQATLDVDEHDQLGLNEFQIEIQKVTDYVKDPVKAKKEEQKELHKLNTVSSYTNDLSQPNTMSSPTWSTDLSVSYSDINDDQSFVHGANFSSPNAEFHRESAIPTVVAIHDLLTMRDQTLFFIHESDDSDSDMFLDDEELSEQRKTQDLNQIDQTKTVNKTNKTPTRKKKKKKKSKLQKSLSERGLTFAISEGHVYFNWTAFIREWIYNFLNWLGIPLVWYCENLTGLKSRFYWPCEWNAFGWIYAIITIGFFYIHILYFAYFPSDKLETYGLALLVYDITYLARITVVAIKWAYLPPQIFPMMRKKQLTTEQIRMIHLLTGWVNHENRTGLAREIGQCCARLELDINRLKFAFRDERRQKLKSNNLCLRRRCSTYITWGNLLIPYIVFCASEKIAKLNKHTKLICCILSPLMCMLPVISAISKHDSFMDFINNSGYLIIIWWFFFWITCSLAVFMLILFCEVIALDFGRRYTFVRFSTRLIELKKDAFQGFITKDYKLHLFPDCFKTDPKMLESAIIQTLDLSDAETMYNWSLLRSFFLDFGLRFLRREEAILSFFVVATFIIMAYYFSTIFFTGAERNFYDLLFVTSVSLAVLLPGFTALRYATRINQKVGEQRSILADKRLRLENEKSQVNKNKQQIQIEATSAAIGRAAIMLEKIVKMLEVDRFTIRLLGYSVDTTVTGVIAAVVGSIGFAMARILLGDDAEGLPDT